MGNFLTLICQRLGSELIMSTLLKRRLGGYSFGYESNRRALDNLAFRMKHEERAD